MITDRSEERDLHAAVCASPKDDAPRVAYQEFVRPFGEEGRARAEFIEWQIQGRIARFSNFLRHAARCLTETRRLTWSEGLAQRTWSMRYHRGFVSAVKVDLGSLAASPERFFGLAALEHLDLFDIKGNLDGFRSLAGRPEWCQIRSISIADAHLGDVDFARVIDAIAHANLEWLGLTGNDLGMAGLEALARATPRMPGLRAVWVDGATRSRSNPSANGPSVRNKSFTSSATLKSCARRLAHCGGLMGQAVLASSEHSARHRLPGLPVGAFFKLRNTCGLELVIFDNMSENDPPSVEH